MAESCSQAAAIEAVILVGGAGTRLRGVVADRPKPMAEVAGRPFVEWLVLALRRQGVRRIVFAAGYMADRLEEHFADGAAWGLEIVHSRESEPLGTGGALRLAVEHVSGDRLLALNGDSFCPFDLARLESAHCARDARCTLWLASVPDAGRFGTVLTAEDGRVLEFVEKRGVAEPGQINAGVYLLERSVVELIAPGGAVSLERDVFPCLIGRGLYGVAGEGPFIDIGTPESYAAAADAFPWQSLSS